jgi:hypothetical protein
MLTSHPNDKETYADAIAIGAREVVPGPVNMGEFQFREPSIRSDRRSETTCNRGKNSNSDC